MRFSQVDTAAAVAANDSGSVAGLRDAALLAVASDGLLRVSEIAALDVGDVQAEADGSGRLLVGESKTDQEGRGAVLYLGALTVTRVNAWLAAAGHQDGGPLAVAGDAGPLCTGPVGSTGRRRSRPLRSRIKPGSTSSTITSLIGGGGVDVTAESSGVRREKPGSTVSSVRSWRGYPVKALHSKAVRQAPPLTAQLGQ